MLLQLSTDRGLNTETIIGWAVRDGHIAIQFITGDNVLLDPDEGLEFLQYVTYSSPWLEVETRHKLLGIKETDD